MNCLNTNNLGNNELSVKIKTLGGVVDKEHNTGITGSSTLMDVNIFGGIKVLYDYGLHQGGTKDNDLNELTDEEAISADYIVITHAHMDHIGRLPLLVKKGFKGKIIMTEKTKQFMQIAFRDYIKLTNSLIDSTREFNLSKIKELKECVHIIKLNQELEKNGLKLKEREKKAKKLKVLLGDNSIGEVEKVLEDNGIIVNPIFSKENSRILLSTQRKLNEIEEIKLQYTIVRGKSNIKIKDLIKKEEEKRADNIYKLNAEIRELELCFSSDLDKKSQKEITDRINEIEISLEKLIDDSEIPLDIDAEKRKLIKIRNSIIGKNKLSYSLEQAKKIYSQNIEEIYNNIREYNIPTLLYDIDDVFATSNLIQVLDVGEEYDLTKNIVITKDDSDVIKKLPEIIRDEGYNKPVFLSSFLKNSIVCGWKKNLKEITDHNNENDILRKQLLEALKYKNLYESDERIETPKVLNKTPYELYELYKEYIEKHDKSFINDLSEKQKFINSYEKKENVDFPEGYSSSEQYYEYCKKYSKKYNKDFRRILEQRKKYVENYDENKILIAAEGHDIEGYYKYCTDILLKYSIENKKDIDVLKAKKVKVPFSQEDINKAKSLLKVIFDKPNEKVVDSFKLKFLEAGHIQGSIQALVTLVTKQVEKNISGEDWKHGKKEIGYHRVQKESKRFLFTGDLGKFNQPNRCGKPDIPTEYLDFVQMETTYVDRNHPDKKQEFERLVTEIAFTEGITIIPTFCLDRLQEAASGLGERKYLDGEKKNIVEELYSLYKEADKAYKLILKKEKLTVVETKNKEKLFLVMGFLIKKLFSIKSTIFDRDIIIDTPTGKSYCELYGLLEEYKMLDPLVQEAKFGYKVIKYFEGNDYITLYGKDKKASRVVVAAGNGMCQGGGILNHLKKMIDDSKSKIIFIGYQAKGSLGHKLLSGEKQVLIEGVLYDVKCDIVSIGGYSSHIGKDDMEKYILEDLNFTKGATISLNHGGEGRERLATLIKETKNYVNVVVPKMHEEIKI